MRELAEISMIEKGMWLRELKELKSKLDGHDGEKEVWAMEKAMWLRELNELKSNQDFLLGEKVSWATGREDLQAKLLQAGVDYAQQKKSWSGEKVEIERNVTDLEAVRKQLQSQLSTARKDLDQVNSELGNIKKHCDHLQSQLSAVKKDLVHANSELIMIKQPRDKTQLRPSLSLEKHTKDLARLDKNRAQCADLWRQLAGVQKDLVQSKAVNTQPKLQYATSRAQMQSHIEVLKKREEALRPAVQAMAAIRTREYLLREQAQGPRNPAIQQ